MIRINIDFAGGTPKSNNKILFKEHIDNAKNFKSVLEHYSPKEAFKQLSRDCNNYLKFKEEICNILLECYNDLTEKYFCGINDLGQKVVDDLNIILTEFGPDKSTGIKAPIHIQKIANMIKSNQEDLRTAIFFTNNVLIDKI